MVSKRSILNFLIKEVLSGLKLIATIFVVAGVCSFVFSCTIGVMMISTPGLWMLELGLVVYGLISLRILYWKGTDKTFIDLMYPDK